MAQSPLGNVVPLDPRARARPSRKESADLLTGCRELAGQRMSEALSGMLDRIEDDLFELAEKAPEREAQNMYLDARSQAREKRAQIEAAFERHFVEFFDLKMRGEAAPAKAEDADELSLVGDEDLEESLAVQEMSRKLQSACEGELGALSARVGYLLEKPELADEANPLSPWAMCAALKDACDQIQTSFKVRMTLLRRFEHYAQEELQDLYHELNAHLVELRVLPEIRPGVRRNPNGPAPARKAAEKPKAATPPAARAEGDILGALAQLLHGASQAAGLAGAVPAAPGPATVPPAFVTELTKLHREPGEALAQSPEALMNVVRRVKSSPQSASLGTVDAMTIDIVAMLFDYIFEDPQIPAAVKALLGRLQIPILKVALLDKAFFSSKAHAARRMLDLLAESSIGLAETGERQAAALAMITEVVDTVLAEFDTDIALFERMVARVEGYIEAQKRAERAIVERSAKLIEERERDEVARAIASAEIERRLETRAWVPAPIRDMLTDGWARALANVQRNEGEGSGPWHGLLRTMDDLLWSVEPKVLPDDRKRLITMLPTMLRELQEGMGRADFAEAARNAFLGALVDCHAQAVKAGMRGLAALPEAKPAKRPARKEPSIEREVIPAGDIRVEEIRLRKPAGDAAVRNVFTRTGIWTNLQRGTWVEFRRDEGAPMRSRLTWISPNKGVYLFTNPFEANTAMSISPEALAEQMRVGEARVLAEAPLVERAVDSMLEELRGAQG